MFQIDQPGTALRNTADFFAALCSDALSGDVSNECLLLTITLFDAGSTGWFVGAAMEASGSRGVAGGLELLSAVS